MNDSAEGHVKCQSSQFFSIRLMCNQGGSGPPQPAVQRRLCSRPRRRLLSHSCWLLDTFCQTEKKKKRKIMLSSAQFSLSLCPLLFRSLFLGVDSRELKFIRLGDSFHFMRMSAFKQMELFILNPPSVLVFQAGQLRTLYWIIDIFLEGFRPKLSSINPWRN